MSEASRGAPSPLSEVLRLASYAILTSFLQTFVFIVDRALLGHYSGAALGQMQISGTVEWCAFAVFSGFFAATFARIGRHVGARDRTRAVLATRLSVFVGLAFGLVLVAMTPLVLAILPRLAPSASPVLLSEARVYLGITLLASPLVFVGTAGISVLQAGGDTKTPLLIGVVSNSVHIALNWVLVLGAFGLPAMGSRGAGIGTAITFFIETVLVVLALLRRGTRASLRMPAGLTVPPGELRALRSEEARELARIGVPAVAEKIVYQTGFLLFVAIIAALGDRVMEANQALIGLESICFLSADGFAVATAALVAQKIGAKDEGAVLAVTRSAVLASVTWLTGIAILFFFLRQPLVEVFSKDPETVDSGVRTMWVFLIAQPFTAIAQVLSAALRGAGRTGLVFGVSTLGAFFVRLGATYAFALPLHMGLPGVWLGSTADWVARSVVLVPLVFYAGLIGKGPRSRPPGTAPTRT